MQVARVESRKGDGREEQQDGQLDQDHGRVHRRGLRRALDQQQDAQDDEQDRRQVELAGVDLQSVGTRYEHGRMQRGGHLPADGVGQEVVEVVRPPDRRGAGREAIFQKQAGRHREGREFAERRVGERIGRPRGRDPERQLRVAQRRQSRRQRGDQEGQDHGGSGLGHRLGHREEDPGPDRRADAQHRQREDAQRLLEGAALRIARGERRVVRRLDANQFPTECPDHADAFARGAFDNLSAVAASNGRGCMGVVSAGRRTRVGARYPWGGRDGRRDSGRARRKRGW